MNAHCDVYDIVEAANDCAKNLNKAMAVLARAGISTELIVRDVSVVGSVPAPSIELQFHQKIVPGERRYQP